MNNKKKFAIVFGASGSIGKSVCKKLTIQKYNVFKISASSRRGYLNISNPLHLQRLKQNIKQNCSVVVWAQGKNINDSIENFKSSNLDVMFDANVRYILYSCQILLKEKLLSKNARMCIISSIWQNLSRKNKLSYSITKSSLKGLVQSMSSDLAKYGISVNAILPGPIDNKMTRLNLTDKNLDSFINSTPYKKIVKTSDVAEAVSWICSKQAEGVSAQFITLDYGYSNLREV